MLNKELLKNQLTLLFDSMLNQVSQEDPMSHQQFAQGLADAIDAYVRGALVLVDNFVASNTAGPITGTATGGLQ